MHRLSASFILGYHGCDRDVGERVLRGEALHASNNEYDWLGPGIYFWEANPERGFDFAKETSKRRGSRIRHPFVIGAIIELGQCLDLTTKAGLDMVSRAYKTLASTSRASRLELPRNSPDLLRRNLDCAVIRRLHKILEDEGSAPIDTVKGIFTEGPPLYPNSGFFEKTHVQIAVRNTRCVKGVFRVSTSAR